MRHPIVAMLLVLVSCVPAHAHTPDKLPIHPVLTQSGDAAICKAWLNRLTASWRGHDLTIPAHGADLPDNPLTPRPLTPDPELKQRFEEAGIRASGVYSLQRRGGLVVSAHFRATVHSDSYLLYFADPARLEQALDAAPVASSWRAWMMDHAISRRRLDYDYPPPLVLVSDDNRLFYAPANRTTGLSDFTLIEIGNQPDDKPDPVCTASLHGPQPRIRDRTDLPRLKRLSDLSWRISGSGGSCGSARSGERFAGRSIRLAQNMLARPWVFAKREPTRWQDMDWFQYLQQDWRNTGVHERRLFAALSGAWAPAATELAQYYRNAFGYDVETADRIALAALQQVIPARYNPPYLWMYYTRDGPQQGDPDPRTARLILRRTLLDGKRPDMEPDQPHSAAAQPDLTDSLHYAIEHPRLMTWLISQGADVNHPNAFGKTPLMLAAQLNLQQSARLLLHSGADLEARIVPHMLTCDFQIQRGHLTALIYAAEYADTALTNMLLDAGADPTVTDSQGNPIGWYLHRNTRLTPDQRTTLLVRINAPAAPAPDR